MTRNTEIDGVTYEGLISSTRLIAVRARVLLRVADVMRSTCSPVFTAVHAVSSAALDSAARRQVSCRRAQRVPNASQRGVASRATTQCNFDCSPRIAADHIGIVDGSHARE
jgi:hypothetical protein